MDATEVKAREFLVAQGYTSPIYEPDGNVPPDFLVGSEIAVEVRRLNQFDSDPQHRRGLEETRYPLSDQFESLLQSFGAPTVGRSWFVHFRFQRPIDSWKILRPQIAKWLREFRNQDQIGPTEREFGPHLKVSIRAASWERERLFMLGGYTDRDANGFVVSKLVESIPLCVAEKELKIASHRSKYPIWWLVLVDRIAYDQNDYDRAALMRHVSFTSTFDRIVLVNPNNPASFTDVKFVSGAS